MPPIVASSNDHEDTSTSHNDTNNSHRITTTYVVRDSASTHSPDLMTFSIFASSNRDNNRDVAVAGSRHVSCEDVPTQPRLIIRLPFAVPTRPPEARATLSSWVVLRVPSTSATMRTIELHISSYYSLTSTIMYYSLTSTIMYISSFLTLYNRGPAQVALYRPKSITLYPSSHVSPHLRRLLDHDRDI